MISSKDSERWLQIDKHGNCCSVVVDRHDLVNELGVRVRDLRAVDPKASDPDSSAILIRDRAILVSLDSIRMVITVDQIYVSSVPADDRLGTAAPPTCKSRFVAQLCRRIVTPARKPYEAEWQRLPPPSTRILPADRESEQKTLDSVHADRLHDALVGTLAGADDRSVSQASDGSDSQVDVKLPFELRALEAALANAVATYEVEVCHLEQRIRPALDRLAAKVTRGALDEVRQLKGVQSALASRLTRLRQELEDILDDDLDMLDMYLSRKAAARAGAWPGGGVGSAAIDSPAESAAQSHPQPSIATGLHRAANSESDLQRVPLAARSRQLAVLAEQEHLRPGRHGHSEATAAVDPHDIEECEDLLETYFLHVDSLRRRLERVEQAIDDTEDYVNVELDHRRNELVSLNLIVATIAAALGFGTFISGVFGQNLGNANLDTSWPAFYIITFTTVAITLVSFCGFMGYARYRRLLFIPELPL